MYIITWSTYFFIPKQQNSPFLSYPLRNVTVSVIIIVRFFNRNDIFIPLKLYVTIVQCLIYLSLDALRNFYSQRRAMLVLYFSKQIIGSKIPFRPLSFHFLNPFHLLFHFLRLCWLLLWLLSTPTPISGLFAAITTIASAAMAWDDLK